MAVFPAIGGAAAVAFRIAARKASKVRVPPTIGGAAAVALLIAPEVGTIPWLPLTRTLEAGAVALLTPALVTPALGALDPTASAGADALGARYYGLPGEFDYMGELTNMHKPYACIDHSGVQSVGDASRECLEKLLPPDVVILSKPDTFDTRGDIVGYLKAQHFAVVQSLPAFTIWRRSTPAQPLKQ